MAAFHSASKVYQSNDLSLRLANSGYQLSQREAPSTASSQLSRDRHLAVQLSSHGFLPYSLFNIYENGVLWWERDKPGRKR